MALRHAVLATLLASEHSGYELAKAFEVGVANFWHAAPQQVYAELAKLENCGLVTGREIIQRGRPNKRLFVLTEAGLAELTDFVAAPFKPSFVRDELLVKIYAAQVADTANLIVQLEQRAEQAVAKLELLDGVLTHLRDHADEATYLATTSTPGRYLACVRGRMYEQDQHAWCTWAIAVLRARASGDDIPLGSRT